MAHLVTLGNSAHCRGSWAWSSGTYRSAPIPMQPLKLGGAGVPYEHDHRGADYHDRKHDFGLSTATTRPNLDHCPNLGHCPNLDRWLPTSRPVCP